MSVSSFKKVLLFSGATNASDQVQEDVFHSSHQLPGNDAQYFYVIRIESVDWITNIVMMRTHLDGTVATWE